MKLTEEQKELVKELIGHRLSLANGKPGSWRNKFEKKIKEIEEKLGLSEPAAGGLNEKEI